MKSVALHSKLKQILLRSFTFILFFALSFTTNAQDIDEARQKAGQKLYKQLCASCHKLDKKLVGPALGGVEERRENEWLIKWIRNNAELRASGDRDAIAIYEEYNAAAMNAFPQLSDEQINDILYYTTVGDPVKAVAAAAPGEGAAVAKGPAPEWLIYILAAAIVVAFLMIASLLKQDNEL